MKSKEEILAATPIGCEENSFTHGYIEGYSDAETEYIEKCAKWIYDNFMYYVDKPCYMSEIVDAFKKDIKFY